MDIMDGIREDANREAEAILAEARKTVEARRAAAAGQAAGILAEAEKRAAELEARILKDAEIAAGVESRRLGLRVRDRTIRECIEMTRVRLLAMVGTADYRKVLLGWIVEAAIGLGAEEAAIDCSPDERETARDLIGRAEEEVTRLTGRKVTIAMTEVCGVRDQGIVLTAKDGKTAYSNQVHVRLERYESRIRSLVYRELFSE